MTARTAALVAALSLGAFASSAFAGETRTFTAWGHEFEAPSATAAVSAPSAPSSYAVLSATPATSSRVRPITRQEIMAAPLTAMPEPTINVWGARFSTSGR